MSGDAHVRFWEGLGVKFPGATQLMLGRLAGSLIDIIRAISRDGGFN